MKEILKDKLLFVFDLDGTLVDSIGVWDEIDIEALKQCGITPRVTLPKERANFLHSCTDENIYEKYEGIQQLFIWTIDYLSSFLYSLNYNFRLFKKYL